MCGRFRHSLTHSTQAGNNLCLTHQTMRMRRYDETHTHRCVLPRFVAVYSIMRQPRTINTKGANMMTNRERLSRIIFLVALIAVLLLDMFYWRP